MIEDFNKPETVLEWFGSTIVKLYKEAQDGKEKASVILNSISRAVDSWGRLYGNHVQNSRIEELAEQLNQITRDMGKGKIEAVK